MILKFQKEPIKLPKESELPKVATEQPQATQQHEPEPEPIPAPVQYTQPEAAQEVTPTPAPVHASQQQQPDVIPTQRESVQSDIYETVAPPPAFSTNGNGIAAENVPEIVQSVPNPVVEEQIYSNVNYTQQPTDNHAPPHEAEQITQPTALAGSEDCNLSDYIEDTKIQAIALYDYQASAEDEISFDPNDIITHIEKVSIEFSCEFLQICGSFTHFLDTFSFSDR